MKRWMCGVSLKDRNEVRICTVFLSVDIGYRSACRNMEVAGVRCRRRNKKTWRECVKDDVKVFGLQP